ncbi:hypothetical protein Tco_1152424 [Tanacetum coccineum]
MLYEGFKYPSDVPSGCSLRHVPYRINATPSACAPAFLPGRHIGVSAMNAFRNEYGFLPLRHIAFRGFDLPFGAMHSGCTLLARPLECYARSSSLLTTRGINSAFGCYARWLVSFDQQRGIISPFGAMHAGSSLLTGGQQRGIISPFGAMHAGSSLLTGGQQRAFRGFDLPFGAMHSGCTLLARPLECYARWLVSFDQQRGIISPFGAMHAGSSLLTGGQQRGIISPFGAMHAGSSLLTGGQQRVLCTWLSLLITKSIISPFGAMHAASSLLTRSQQRVVSKRYIMPFGAMHTGSSLLTYNQQRAKRYIMPFGAVHAGSSLLTRSQQREVLIRLSAVLFWLTAFRGFNLPFGAMHSGCTLFARPLEVLIRLSVPCTLTVSFDRWSAKRYIMPFGVMHAGSSLLISKESAKRYIMPFGAMHAGSSLLTRSQQRGILCLSVLCTLAHPRCVNIVRGIPDGLASYRGKM